MDFYGVGPKIGRILIPWWAITIILSLTTESFRFTSERSMALSIVGAAYLVFGLVFYFTSVKLLLKGLKEGKLVTKGTFFLCQNPLYVSFVLMLIPAIGLLLNSWLALTTSVFGLILMKVYVSNEYQELEKFFGEEYLQYKKETPEFVPLPIKKWTKRLTFLTLLTVCFLSVSAQERIIKTSDGVDLYVKVAGEGIPCLYLHGGPGSGSYWAEKFAGDMLGKHLQMIYLDQRGVGRSGSPASGDFSTNRMIKDFEEVRSALKIDKWLTMGHSFGGILQMQYSQRYPQSIQGMLMINCTLKLNDGNAPLQKAYEFLDDPSMKKYLNDSIPALERMGKLYGALRDKGIFWKMAYASKASEEMMGQTFGEIQNWNSDYEPNAIENADTWIDYKPFSAEMTMPVLFFYGKTDWMVGTEHYKGIKFPNVIFWGSDVGHIPFIENKPDLENAISSYLEKFKL